MGEIMIINRNMLDPDDVDNYYSCIVDTIIDYSNDIKSLKLRFLDDAMKYSAGQYINFIMDNGETRSLSIANCPVRDGVIELHIKYVEGGDLSKYIFNLVNVEDKVTIQGPYGLSPLNLSSSRPIIFVCGGTGVAPIKGMLESMISNGVMHSKNIHLYWGVKTNDDLYIDDLLKSWSKTYINFKYVPVVQGNNKNKFVHDAVINDFDNLSEFDIYLCGPKALIESAKRDFTLLNANKRQLFHN